jgi:hypothetical protein
VVALEYRKDGYQLLEALHAPGWLRDRPPMPRTAPQGPANQLRLLAKADTAG